MTKKIPMAPLLLVLLAPACMAPVGSGLDIPPDAAKTCAEHCATVGMRLSAIAIMANNVGCVCQPAGPAPVAHESSVTAGMATIAMQDAEQRRQQQLQQLQQR